MQKWELHWTKSLVRTKKTKKKLEQENKTLTVKLVSHNYILENWFSTQEEWKWIKSKILSHKISETKQFLKWTISEKIQTGGLRTGNCQGYWKKIMWKFQGWARKNHVKFPKVLVSGIGNSNGHNTILWKFQGEASFCLEFPPCLDFFWNSLMASKSLINTWGE